MVQRYIRLLNKTEVKSEMDEIENECPYSTVPVVTGIGLSKFEIHMALISLNLFYETKQKEIAVLKVPLFLQGAPYPSKVSRDDINYMNGQGDITRATLTLARLQNKVVKQLEAQRGSFVECTLCGGRIEPNAKRDNDLVTDFMCKGPDSETLFTYHRHCKEDSARQIKEWQDKEQLEGE